MSPLPMPAPMLYRLHFTDGSLATMEQLGLDRDAVRTVIHQGSKAQLGENHLVCRHHGLEVEVRTLGADYEVLDVRPEREWPRRETELAYLERLGGGA